MARTTLCEGKPLIIRGRRARKTLFALSAARFLHTIRPAPETVLLLSGLHFLDCLRFARNERDMILKHVVPGRSSDIGIFLWIWQQGLEFYIPYRLLVLYVGKVQYLGNILFLVDDDVPKIHQLLPIVTFFLIQKGLKYHILF